MKGKAEFINYKNDLCFTTSKFCENIESTIVKYDQHIINIDDQFVMFIDVQLGVFYDLHALSINSHLNFEQTLCSYL